MLETRSVPVCRNPSFLILGYSGIAGLDLKPELGLRASELQY